MYELNQVGANSYYINCPAKIGIYKKNHSDIYLIDSGNDKEAGKKARRLAQENGWQIKGIINTHSNADHIGGNRYLQQQTGCKIFAAGIEAAFTTHPILEPSFLYGGYPCKDLRHKFLLAEPSEVTAVDDDAFPAELQIIPLPGHFFDMIGVRTPDQTVFLADCISSKATLEKYRIPFIYDVKAYLQTLDTIEKIEGAMFVPAHAEATTDIKELVQYNRESVLAIANHIQSLLQSPLCFEALLQKLFDAYNLTMTIEQYALVGSTVRSYLSYLKDSEKIEVLIENNLLQWHAI